MSATNPPSSHQSRAKNGEKSQEQEGNIPESNATNPATQIQPQPLTTALTAGASAQVAPQAPHVAQVTQPAPAGAAALPPLPATDANGYFHRDQVDAYEQWYNFHHKGKGKWSAGLPNPGSDPRTGVRGPGAAVWKAANVGQ